MLQSIAALIPQKVGVRYFPATESHPPLRIFYPLSSSSSSFSAKTLRPYKWLEEYGVFYYLYGNVRIVCERTVSWLLLTPLIWFVSWVLPVQWRKIPNVYSIHSDDSDFILSSSCSLFDNNNSSSHNINTLKAIVFSHGLTGTGQEHAVLLAAWASLGFLVVSVHHTDGSSSRVRLESRQDLWYRPGPSFSNYDASFRPRQLEHRCCQDIQQACAFVERLVCLNHDTQKKKHPNHVAWLVAGYSYGAATAARVADERTFQAALLLDGWFYIDVSESAGIEFRFPQQAFRDNSGIKRIPARLFVNSQQFANMPKLYQATCEMAGVTSENSTTGTAVNRKDEPDQQPAEMRILKDAAHLNFCEIIYWAPVWLWRLVLGTQLGVAEPVSAYEELVSISCQFLIKHFGKSNDKD